MPNYFHTQDLIASFELSLSPDIFDRRLLVVGLGGNGSHVALAAVRMGFSTIVGVDRDLVSESNLSRQVLYTRGDVGRPKAEVAAPALGRHNLRSQIETHHLDILAERSKFLGLVSGADLVFLALDQPSTTFFAADACFRARKPAVTGGTCVLSGLATRVWWMGPGQSPCLNCLVPAHPSMAEWVCYWRPGRPRAVPGTGDDEGRRQGRIARSGIRQAVENRLGGRGHRRGDIGPGHGVHALDEESPSLQDPGILGVELSESLEREGSGRAEFDPAEGRFRTSLVRQMGLDDLEALSVGDRAMERDVGDLEARFRGHATRVRGDSGQEAVVSRGMVHQGHESDSRRRYRSAGPGLRPWHEVFNSPARRRYRGGMFRGPPG
jgi:molybdopterin/thiamine biosynthesis adenylyltransferase